VTRPIVFLTDYGLDDEFVVRYGSTYGVVMGYLLRMEGFAPTLADRADVPHLLEAEPTTRTLLLLARQGEFSVLRTQLPLCVVSGLQGRVMATYRGVPCHRALRLCASSPSPCF